jgi:hypothetical protein
MKSFTAFILLMLMTSYVFAENGEAESPKVAVASIIRGEVDLLIMGKTIRLKKDDWVKEGSVVKTADKSFVKLIFIDKSQMNIGPNTEMKIAKFNGNDAGIIDLVKGKIRSQVTKDYLQMKDKDRSKIFVKTPNAVMGIRGTDFMISTNGINTSAVLFEGSVVFAKNTDFRNSSTDRLEDLVNGGVRMHPGEFSVVEQARSRPTEPAFLNIEQREVLEKNDNFDSDRNPSNSNAQKVDSKSVVPEGLSGAVVSNNSESIKSEVASNDGSSAAKSVPSSSDPNGYIKGEKLKPANGSFVHLESGTIIPPGPGSVLDTNTNTYIPGPDQGDVTTMGEYSPPKNVEITSDGKIMIAFKDASGVMQIQEIEKPTPLINDFGVSLGSTGDLIANQPSLINSTGPITNDILNNSFAPSGLNDLSNLQQNTSGSTTLIESQSSTKSRVIIIGN